MLAFRQNQSRLGKLHYFYPAVICYLIRLQMKYIYMPDAFVCEILMYKVRREV